MKAAFTKDQEDFFEERIEGEGGFLEARHEGGKLRAEFFEKLYAAFHERWPPKLPEGWTPPSNAEGPALAKEGEAGQAEEGGTKKQLTPEEQELAKARTKTEDQIVNWLGNHTGSRSKASRKAAKDTQAVADVLLDPPQRQTRQKQKIYIYQAMFRPTLNPVLRNAWAVEKKLQGYSNDNKRASHRNALLTKLLAEESEDVRAKVEEKWKESAEENKKAVEQAGKSMLTETEKGLSEEEQKNLVVAKKRKAVIDRLDGIMTEVSRSIKARSGWEVFCMATGPDPTKNGKFLFVSAGSGALPGKDGKTKKTFAHYYPNFTQNVAVPFGQFAKKIIPEDEWIRYVFDPKTGAVTSSEVLQTAGASGSGTSSVGSTASASASSNPLTNSKKSAATEGDDAAFSDEEDEDEQLQLIFDNPDNLDLTPEEVEERQREETPPPFPHRLDPRSPNCPSLQILETFMRGENEMCRLPDRIVTRYEHDSLVNIAKGNKLLESLGLKEAAKSLVDDLLDDDKAEDDAGGLPESFVMPPPRTQQPRAAKNTGTAATTSSGSHTPTSTSTAFVTEPSCDAPPPLDVISSPADTLPQSIAGGGEPTTSGNTPLPDHAVRMSPVVAPTDSQKEIPNVVMGGQSSSPQRAPVDTNPVAPSPTRAPFAPLDQNVATTTAPPPTAPSKPQSVQADVVVDLGGIDVTALPEWMQQPFAHLRDHFVGEEESKLVKLWVDFEMLVVNVATRGNGLGNESRPSAILYWQKDRRKKMDAPKNVDIEEFMHDWRAWYAGLMPSWRLNGLGTAKWPLRRNVPDLEDWAKACKGERNGVFLFVVTLYWWKSLTTKGSNERDQYESTLEDVLWLLPLLVNTSTLAHGGGGAPSNATTDTSAIQTRTRKRKHDDHDALAPQGGEPNKRKTRSDRNEAKEVQEAPRTVRSTRATAAANARSTRSGRH